MVTSLFNSKIDANSELILKSRYYHKDAAGNCIEDWEGLCQRVASCISSVELNDSRRMYYKTEFYNILHNLDFLPNSPTLVNAGKNMGLSGCYVLPIHNSYEEILETAKTMALVHKSGGGTGFNFSHIKLDPIIQKSLLYLKKVKVCVSIPDDHPDADYFHDAKFKRLTKLPTGCNSDLKTIMQQSDYVLTIDDTMESIFNFQPLLNFLTKAAQKQNKNKGKVKTIIYLNFKRLRQKDSIVRSTSGVASGPVSFMYVWDAAVDFLINDITPITTIKFFNACTEAVKQGGVRRGANMGIVYHNSPYIKEFITCKEDQNVINNFNLSVGVTNSKSFFDFSNDDLPLIDYSCLGHSIFNIYDYKHTPVGHASKKEIYDMIVDHAWRNGEPGIIFFDRINSKSTVPSKLIESTNPCGEQPLFPNESCNLGSVNLANFVIVNKKGERNFDFDRFTYVVKLAVRFLDNVIDVNNYVTSDIKKSTQYYRKIGLGVMGLADVLFLLAIPYDSDQALDFSKRVAGIFSTTAWNKSEELAKEKGECGASKDGNVHTPYDHRHVRNSTVTTIAPTGTISIIAGVSSGIEPVFRLAYKRNSYIGKGSLDIVTYYVIDPIVKQLFEYHGFSEEMMNEWAKTCDFSLLKGFTESEIGALRRIFVTTNDINYKAHIAQQAAWQMYIDNAVSKTINLPSTATKQDIEDAYAQAYNTGCKGITVYRDKSRDSQVLNDIKEKSEDKGVKDVVRDTSSNISEKPLSLLAEKDIPVSEETDDLKTIKSRVNDNLQNLDIIKRDKEGFIVPMDRPTEMEGATIKEKIGCGNLYITINHQNGKIMEIFTNTGKSGGCASQSEATARLASIALRAGISPNEVINQLKGIRCGSCIRRDGCKVLSCPDAIGRALEKFHTKLKDEKNDNTPLENPVMEPIFKTKRIGTDEIVSACPECGMEVEFEGGCVVCRNCGYSKCH